MAKYVVYICFGNGISPHNLVTRPMIQLHWMKHTEPSIPTSRNLLGK